jgi:hypothetical protein
MNDFVYYVRTVNSRRLVGHYTENGDSAAEVLERYRGKGYRRVDVAPASRVNGYSGNLPTKPGDVAFFEDQPSRGDAL